MSSTVSNVPVATLEFGILKVRCWRQVQMFEKAHSHWLSSKSDWNYQEGEEISLSFGYDLNLGAKRTETKRKKKKAFLFRQACP